MKTILLTLFLGLSCLPGFSQGGNIDSLNQRLAVVGQNDDRVMTLLQLSLSYINTNPDSSLLLAQQASTLARNLGFPQGQARSLFHLAHAYRILGDIPKSMQASLDGLQIAEDHRLRQEAALCTYNIGVLYLNLLNDYPKALGYFRKANQWNEPVRDAMGAWLQLTLNLNFGITCQRLNRLDSAAVYYEVALSNTDVDPGIYPAILMFYGTLQANRGRYPEALAFSRTAIPLFLARKDHRMAAEAYFYQATYLRDLGQPDSCLFYARSSLSEAELISHQQFVLKAATLLAETYEARNDPEALRFYKIAKLANDQVYGEQKVQALQRIITDDLERRQEAERVRTAQGNRLRQNTLLGGLGGVLLIAFLLYRNNRQRRKANAVLQSKNRELEVEAALERVRARTMAMHKSEELSELVKLMYKEIEPFGVSTFGISIAIFREEENAIEYWFADHLDSNLLQSYKVAGQKNKVYKQNWEDWKNHKTQAKVYMEGQEKWDFDTFFLEETEFRKLPEDLKLDIRTYKTVCLTFTFFKYGYFESVDLTIPGEENANVLIRFANVFEQTYTRFLDLQRAEAQAREAQIDAGLERVRAEIVSMRNPGDLQRITPLVWRELTTLGVPFFRCGVFIVDEAAERVHAYLSTPDGAPLGVLHLPFEGAETTRKTVDHWRRGEVYTDFWDRQQFLDWVRSMTEQGFVGESATYQGGEEPPEALALQFVPFTQGMLYVGSTESLPDEQIDLLRRLADTFAVAYARYEDFIQLEEAKKRVEFTLTELKATQTQFIQQEKLASLGELTAGIAHEIQNPLNFVNNFAEVSADLVDEMEDELKQGQTEEAIAIAADLKQNLAKIHHHGGRASSIVKSMLQHSRAGTGEQEPTDLNALIDECIRLSYHGLRAQEPGFQAKYELELDDNLPKIPVVRQDIGRVLLNLFNNAFYAVNEKRKLELNEIYQPLVRVTTHCTDGVCSIKVEDNGPGIPDAIREKIFQPFFTTKPTGQGTGLGLSLAYDIITKGHVGKLEVETKDDEGTEFIIHLSNNNQK